MQITDVRVRKIAKEGKMKAIVSITLDNEFVVHDIKIIEGEKGLFIAMPSKKATDGEYKDIAHPINSSTRENMQRIILESYEKALAEPEEAVKEEAAVESACSEKDEPKPVPGEPEASARAEEGASEDAE